jgi:indole-3-glycerol phosphate synthase / phosphoribosylanthranilate isomerase
MGRFRDALSQPGLGAIAEVKRRSPSAGDLRPDADPAELAAAFEAAGASAVSILVDERFAGTWDDLRAASAVASLPLLAKGFFSTRKHLETARTNGADAVLLLLRDLDDAQVRELMGVAGELGLDTLVEAHDAGELARATALNAPVIGLNARDLGTFEIDRRKQLGLVAVAPRERIVVAESGILNRAHGAAAELAGADAVLVGSTLMRAPDPAATLADLLRRPYVKVCGLTREEDVAVAAEAGADFAGFVLAESPRRAAAPLPVPETMLSVGVFVGETEEVGTDLAQLYAQENGHRARDGVLLRGDEVVAHVKDLPWLEEDDGHWKQAARAEGRVLLAGGLGPENVRTAIEAVDPWCVDASRSLEASPGIKDHDRVRAFVEAAR